MLIFKRDEFKAGVMIVEDREKNDKGEWVVLKKQLTVKDKNQPIQFDDENFVLEKYAQFFKKA